MLLSFRHFTYNFACLLSKSVAYRDIGLHCIVPDTQVDPVTWHLCFLVESQVFCLQ